MSPETILTDRVRTVVFDLHVLLDDSADRREVLLYYLDRDGLELIVLSDQDRRSTREALRSAGLLRYLDDLIFSESDLPPEFLRVATPTHCRYSYIAKNCIRPDRRPFHLSTDLF